MAYLFSVLSLFLMLNSTWAQQGTASGPYEELAQEFLYALRMEEMAKADSIYQALQKLDRKALAAELKTDAQRKAFWLNCYNGFILYILRKNPEAYKDRGSFFSKKQMTVAGVQLSFDNIEHGILRRSTMKYSLGYFSRWFVPKYERLWRVDKLDHRIHFALNCGAASCPPIAFYGSKSLENQLAIAEEGFIKGNTEVNKEQRIAKVSQLFSWFRGDFGGEKGTLNLLLKDGLIPDLNYKLEYSEYDWTLDLENKL